MSPEVRGLLERIPAAGILAGSLKVKDSPIFDLCGADQRDLSPTHQKHRTPHYPDARLAA